MVLMTTHAGTEIKPLMIFIFLDERCVAEHTMIYWHGADKVIAGTNVPVMTIQTSIRTNVPGKITATHDVQIRCRMCAALTEHFFMAVPATRIQHCLTAIDATMTFGAFKIGMTWRKWCRVRCRLPLTNHQQKRPEKQGQQHSTKQNTSGRHYQTRQIVSIDK
nr:hypothetical protein [Marinobacter piscensis]